MGRREGLGFHPEGGGSSAGGKKEEVGDQYNHDILLNVELEGKTVGIRERYDDEMLLDLKIQKVFETNKEGGH